MLHHGKVPRQRLAAMSSLWLLVLFLCPLRVASLNARSENRMLDILAETCKLDALMLAGAGEANKWGVSYDLNGRTIFSSGFTSTSMPNKSCGVSVFVGIAHPVEIQGNAKGGGLAQRIRSGRLDVTCIAAYFPPLPQRKADLPSYRATCREMMGLTSANGSWVQLAARQEFPGGAGEQLRIIPDLHGLFFLVITVACFAGRLRFWIQLYRLVLWLVFLSSSRFFDEEVLLISLRRLLEETAMVMTMSMWVGILLEKRHRLGLLSPERPGPAAPQGRGRL